MPIEKTTESGSENVYLPISSRRDFLKLTGLSATAAALYPITSSSAAAFLESLGVQPGSNLDMIIPQSRIPYYLDTPRANLIFNPDAIFDIAPNIELVGVSYVFDSGVSPENQSTVFIGVLETEFTANALGGIPIDVTVDVRSSPSPDLRAAVSSTNNRVMIDTSNSIWTNSSIFQRMQMSGREYWAVNLRKKTNSQGEVRGAAWLDRGSRDFAFLEGLVIDKKITQDQMIGIYLVNLLNAPTLPTLQSLEDSAPWNQAPDYFYSLGGFATLILLLSRGPNSLMDFYSRTTTNLPWQDAFSAAFGTDPSSYSQVLDQWLKGIRGNNSTPTLTPTRTTTPTATLTPAPTRTESPTPTRTPENQFYTQRRTVYGVDFQASEAVSLAAFEKAVQNFIDLTTHEPESRNRMITNRFGGYRVFGRNQKITDLPEFSRLKGVYYNPEEPDPTKRILYDTFRGLANSAPDGVTAIGEDLLIDWPGIGLHEQSHPRFDYGCTEAQKQEWDGYYDLAKSRNLLPGTYAMNSRGEFWAESAATWRGYNRGFTVNDLRDQIIQVYQFLEARLGSPVTLPASDNRMLIPFNVFKQPPVPGKDFL